jgi:acetyl-CoA C-acetyltransferase
MAEAYIVAAVSTAGGKCGSALAGWHPADMAGEVLS